ncbi:acetoacetyl-CoA reductase [Burkholderia glumae]|uniref:Acetoacetyl-CoA reductase n=1 Tax=Burkholderia glumae TaxID=337 RepID=A0AAQ0BRQ3_BURGL|nr:acetoacetyl-CoA reductase [Burkholderia glumae]ACR32350.1 Acetoacetyl-CoA reductase [Burkholderia glumae BGR1]AJY63144.1 acetoacetyl-CoA reductase family protein [Burkholderia glumae LMG 2196 = ATCC 33617]KHJ63203.1 acetoacetyl-CoA reductase [Burkholderia glumae]MCM2484453.1 acetoacetyl-CoA reductase [Burkholderia glumae]MCM2494822.1 acetoacetyl-CoA reductase [Burkholderia glumae]
MHANGRIAFVTGGMGGLGSAISRKLSDAGFTVAMSYSTRNDHVAAWLCAERDAGHVYRAFELDVGDYDSCQRCARQVNDAYGHVDVLVNNAGITRDAVFSKMTKPEWDEVMHTDLDGIFNVTKPFIGSMVSRGFGRVINVGSVNGMRGAFGQTNYSAAKAGVHGFTMALAREVARHGVTVNTVSPGYLATHMVEAMPKEVLETRVLPQIPVGRLGKPEEVAALIAFLCSAEAAFITGAEIAINGGMQMQ